MANKFFLFYPTTQENFLLFYPTPQQNLMQFTVSQKNLPHCIPQRRRFSSVVSHNGRYFPPLWDTTGEVFFHCGIQRKKLPSIVGYNGRGFFPFWDTTEEFFSIVGYNGKKIIQRRMIFLNSKCLALPSNKNLGQNLLLGTVKPIRGKNEKWKIIWLTNDKIFFPLWDTTQQRFLFYF
jgi:hypothetical protein